MKKSRLSAALIGCVFTLMFSQIVVADDKMDVSKALDQLHKAASDHDAKIYFDLFTNDAIFLGTDATERWDMEAMKKWAIPYFNSGKGWTYTKLERFIYLSDDSKTAWFDERLMNEKYGECRGSGALKKIGENWKIAQYNLSFPVPNEVAKAVVEMNKVGEKLQETNKKLKNSE